jgi:adenosylhomocysteine nucleosidase
MKIVVIVSADAEWRVVKEILPSVEIESTPMGEFFDLALRNGQSARFFHGGWGKVSAAATAQYVIDHFAPELLVNLGTCGGFAGQIEKGAVILVERTILYDIIEQMTGTDEAIRHYATEIDLSWLKAPYPHPARRGLLVSADRDIVAQDIAGLVATYQAVAADWESGAIAWVAHRNSVRLLILRGVSDLVGSGGGEAYGDYALFIRLTRDVMRGLIDQLPDWVGHGIGG